MARKFSDEKFFEYTDKLEGGSVNYMFLIYDQAGGFHVATGFGITFLKPDDAVELPWLIEKGGGASAPQIKADYAIIEKKTDIAGGPGQPHRMGGDPVWKPLTSCRLTPDGLKQGVAKMLENKLRVLRANFPEFDDWPADAQLAAASIQWAGDVKTGWPKLTKALLAKDWAVASTQCSFAETKDTNVFLKMRSQRQVTLFKNAQRVKEGAATEDHLDWETVLP